MGKVKYALIVYDEKQNFPFIAKDESNNTIQCYGESIACKTREEAEKLAKEEGYTIFVPGTIKKSDGLDWDAERDQFLDDLETEEE